MASLESLITSNSPISTCIDRTRGIVYLLFIIRSINLIGTDSPIRQPENPNLKLESFAQGPIQNNGRENN